MDQVFSLQTNDNTQKDATQAPTLSIFELLWNFEHGISIAFHISSFLPMEDKFTLEQVSMEIRKNLTADDTAGIWRKGIMPKDNRHADPPIWCTRERDGPKARAREFVKANNFAKACEVTTDGQGMQEEMGREVAYEFFRFQDLDGPKAGYDIFVRATVVRQGK
jgi:hypothetical protein